MSSWAEGQPAFLTGNVRFQHFMLRRKGLFRKFQDQEINAVLKFCARSKTMMRIILRSLISWQERLFRNL